MTNDLKIEEGIVLKPKRNGIFHKDERWLIEGVRTTEGYDGGNIIRVRIKCLDSQINHEFRSYEISDMFIQMEKNEVVFL